MENPFESGHIKNYLLLYASVVVIVILFFIATSLFHDLPGVEKKVFSTEVHESNESVKSAVVEKAPPKFKLLEKAY